MAKHTHDLIIIGAGAGGLNVAGFARRIGLKVALIEKEPQLIGGDCLNFGCIPSKALIHAARSVARAREAGVFGTSFPFQVDIDKVFAHITEAQRIIREKENPNYLQTLGIDVILGTARFVDPHTVAVTKGSEVQNISAPKIVLATGSAPKPLPIPEGVSSYNDNSIPLLTSETIFANSALFKKPNATLLIMGTGPIGIELGQALLRLGIKVIFVSADSRILLHEEELIAGRLQNQLQAEGAMFYFNTAFSRIEKGNVFVQSYTVTGSPGAFGAPTTLPPLTPLSADMVLIALGRAPRVQGLDLEKVGIAFTERGVVVNEHLQTTLKHVFAVGDVTGAPQFTHIAELQAGIVARNLVAPFAPQKISYDHIGWVTFTDPEIATFGRSKAVLAKHHIHFEELVLSFADDDRAITEGAAARDGVMLVRVNAQGVILGGTIYARQAGEVVSELMLAERHGLTLQHLFDAVYPYPTASRMNRSLAAAFLSRRLEKPSTQKWLRWLYRL
jgi:pyruvate/2-oxoglutarate dehydrogenase complex dihydrolipoamide dehydrogenase (E3) component